MMEKGLFYDLYDRLREVNFRSILSRQVVRLSSRLSYGLHDGANISVVRGRLWSSLRYSRKAKEIARWYEVLVQKKELPANFRAGYAADLMDVYQLYSDLDFLEKEWMLPTIY